MALMHATDRTPEGEAMAPWTRPGIRDLWREPLPHLCAFDRALARFVSYFAMSHFSSISGLENIRGEKDPFILAINHSTRIEALALPPLLLFHRQGKLVHFFADWNFQMIPGLGLLYRRSGAIVVTRKSARPRVLNVLKPLYAHALPSMERAKAHISAGRSIAIFPEGTVNHDPAHLLRGRLGAARLSLETGIPVVPAGIRISEAGSRQPKLAVTFGMPLHPETHRPGRVTERPSTSDVRAWHSVIMCEIARLSGKAWQPTSQEQSHGTQQTPNDTPCDDRGRSFAGHGGVAPDLCTREGLDCRAGEPDSRLGPVVR